MWLFIILVVLAILIAGGIYARNRQLARSRPAFERALTHVDRDLAAAAASDRGWDRAVMEATARQIAADQLGEEVDELVLVEVIDKPGTDSDQAIYDVRAGGRRGRVILGRRDGEWGPAPS